ncbi:hypothetical protein CONPUDRAFT_84251 [Coniophora puteana RWD-64-598 SS2]|uniref:Uncharacterized protein n=1 Tax=Coniophora puteana (strain RWD-64-598) TaxID=741705 RepID=A0A5M3MG52_CONPW|nr:uncharacterized protein CONPUDRAFT_84251 [Coniophora puteana RWD-64-598 SS2]EIW78027.1 hypothetical protein CONPUDRAFT_84251 [Coniophora puteana RWD-64-598 SS2]
MKLSYNRQLDFHTLCTSPTTWYLPNSSSQDSRFRAHLAGTSPTSQTVDPLNKRSCVDALTCDPAEMRMTLLLLTHMVHQHSSSPCSEDHATLERTN